MSIFDNKINKSVAEAVMKVMQQEELKGNQHKIDANKNGKVDAHDFKLLRGKKGMKKEETQLTENFADAVARVGNLPSGKPLAPKPKVKKDNTGRDYFGHDSVRQQSGYRGPGQSVLQTGADAIAKGAKAVGKAVKSSGIGKSVAGGIKAVKSAVKKTFSREEVEFIFDNFMLEDIQYFMVSEEYEMLDESSREMFEYFFEEQALNEGFPTVADAKKRMNAGKTSTGSVTKTKTGLVHKRDYKDEDESDDMQKKAKGYGARQNYKRSTRVNEQLSFTEMLELYNEHGLKVLAPIETEEMDIDGTTIQVIDGDKINGYVETTVEEVTNDEFTKEFKDQQASFEGKKKQPKVAVGKTTGVKEMPEEYELDEQQSGYDTLAQRGITAPGAPTRKGSGTGMYLGGNKPRKATIAKATANLKQDIKDTLGKHRKPNLPEEYELDEASYDSLAQRNITAPGAPTRKGMGTGMYLGGNKPRKATIAKATSALKQDIKDTLGKHPKPNLPEEYELDERSLTSDEKSEMEKNVKGMKKKLSGFKERYGDRAKEVMYATATKMAKKD